MLVGVVEVVPRHAKRQTSPRYGANYGAREKAAGSIKDLSGLAEREKGFEPSTSTLASGLDPFSRVVRRYKPE